MNKKKIFIVLSILIGTLIVVWFISLLAWKSVQKQSEKSNEKYGIKVMVESADKEYVNYKVKVEGREEYKNLAADNNWSILEKYTIFGWESVEQIAGQFTTIKGLPPLSNSREFNGGISLRKYFGKVPSGRYRMKCEIYQTKNGEMVDWYYIIFEL